MPTATRHRWTREEISHLNRVAGRSKNKTEAFRKVAEEMGLPESAVKSTYWNHRKNDGAEEKPRDIPSIFKEVNDEELFEFAATVRSEVDRRVKIIDELRGLYTSGEATS